MKNSASIFVGLVLTSNAVCCEKKVQPEKACSDSVAAEKNSLTNFAEQIFLTYTKNSIHEYKIEQMNCDGESNFFFEGTGADENFGNHVLIIIDRNMQVKIYPGK